MKNRFDPNTALVEILDAARALTTTEDDTAHIADLGHQVATRVLALHEHLHQGGTAPAAWRNVPNF